MPDFDSDGPEDHLAQEAEEMMRQRRFLEAVSRYRDLRSQSPTDLWTNLGYVSALECAGEVVAAEQVLKEVEQNHRRSAALQRFRHLFFVRREDMRQARASRSIGHDLLDDGPPDLLADLYFNQGRYHEALAEFERMARDVDLEEAGLRAGVMARSGACQRQLGQLDEARERLVGALALEPGNHWTLAELAECERALGNVEAARRRYREAMEANGEDHWIKGHLAQLEFEAGHPERSVTLYEEIIAAEAKTNWAKVELAQVLTETDAVRAEKLCQAALEDDPTYPWAHAHLGNLARRAGRLEEARKHYQDAASASPNAAWILHELADTCRRLGRREEAYTHLEHVQRLNPYDAVTLGYLADFLRQDNRIREATANLEKAVQLDAEYTWAWRELSEMRALAGKHDEAEAAYREAIELDPGAAVNDGLRAFLLRCRGDRSAAAAWLERAVEIQPDYLWAWRELIDWHLATGDNARAERAAREALKHLAESHPLMAMLGEALRRQNKLAEASSELGKAIAAGSEHPQVWVVQAQVAASAGEMDAACTFMRRAYELDPSAENQALLAQLFLAINDLEAAAPLVAKLLAVEIPIQPAFEIGAVLAERRGCFEEAIALCDRALASGPARDPRLVVRRSRLIAQGDSSRMAEAAAPLVSLVTQGPQSGLPWRDVAQILAQGGQGTMARIAATRGIDESCGDVPAEARAWLTLAEIEMGLENLPAAGQALERALERDAKLITGQLIGAVLAELRGHHEQSAAHLTQLEILTSAAVEGGEDAAHFIQLKQQVAGLRERLGQYDAAAATWRSLTEENPQRLEVLAERGSFLLRRGRDEEAETIASQLLTTDLHQDLVMGSEFQRFLRDLALRRSSRQDAGLGLRTLQKYVQCLAPTTRLLLAQLAFISGDHALCTQQLDMLATSDERRAASLIRIRLLLVQNNVSAARTLAQTFWDEGHDQDAAVILAEILSGQGDYAQALEILDQADLPTIPSLDRGLLTAYLALELSGENACLARLGRLRPEPRSGLMRVFAQAWPGVWNERLPFHTDDLLTVPAYSRAVGHLALALEKSGRLREAGLLLETMVERLGTHDTAAAARLAAIAVAPLCRTGQRRRALSMARSSGSLRALLRCLMPW